MDDFSQYIESQRAAGSYESAGSFTLAIEKAREKLSSYSLINPEDYILKLVQCATRLGVRELNVKLLSRVVLLFFETDEADTTVSVDALSRSLAAPLEESEPARAYLTMAICAVANQAPTELMWGEWDHQEGIILSLAEGRSEVFRGAPFPRVEPLERGRRLFLFFLKKPSVGLPIGQTAAEHSALTRRCSFAPMPIFLDGHAIEPALPKIGLATDPVSELTSPYLGALEIHADEAQPQLRWPPTRPVKRAWRTLPDELTDVCSALPPVYRVRIPKNFQIPFVAEAHFSAIFGIPIFLYGSSHLYYVKDGVMLAPVSAHDAGGGAFAILDGGHLKTDLTGLQIVLNESVSADIARVTETWKSMIDLMTHSHPPIYSNKPIYKRGSTLVSMMGCCLLGPFGLVVGPIYGFFSSRQSKVVQTRRKLARQLETRRGYLSFNRKKPKNVSSSPPSDRESSLD